MQGDNLFLFLSFVRAEMPEISDEVWDKIKRIFSDHHGGERLYVPAHNRKRSHLEAIAEAGEQATADQLSKILGVTPRRARQLKKLR